MDLQNKVARAFANNAPDYWVIHSGKSAFGSEEIARVANKAHAELFAAAPEMYEALRDLCEWCEAITHTLGPTNSAEMEAQTTNARAILAKLESETP